MRAIPPDTEPKFVQIEVDEVHHLATILENATQMYVDKVGKPVPPTLLALAFNEVLWKMASETAIQIYREAEEG